jgi:serine/threonine protein kinase/Tol biopolymer transport system component
MPVPSTVDEFLDIVVKSGVLEKEVLDPYLQQMRAAGSYPEKPKMLGAALVRDGLLTPFQVGQFLHGKWRGFWISGKYKLLDHLGAGGMGNVFLCEHKSMRRRVAIKVLPGSKAQDPGALERFYREARAVAALDHPHIVRAHDIDHDGRHHFLVLEYVEGASLQDLVKRGGPMDVTRAAHYTRQAALGLHHAHEAGMVHRDVKPGNLLVDRQGVVKILDLGLARFFTDEDDKLTKQHDERNILGTADYLSPEQAINSHAVDIRTDIYSLGATLYFLLAGRPPFAEGTVAQKLIAHQMRTPEPICTLRPETPEGLAAVVGKMMAKDPAQRYQTPAEVYEALAPWTQAPIAPPADEEMPHSSRRLRGVSASASGVRLSTPTTPWPAVVPAVFPSSEATSVQLPSTKARPAAPKWAVLVADWKKKGLSVVRRRPYVWGAAAAVAAVVLITLGSWAFGRLLTASEVPPLHQTAQIPFIPASPTPPVSPAPPPPDGVQRIQTPAYEAAVDADGRLNSLRVRGVEFLAAADGLPRGSYFAREQGQGVLKLSAVDRPAANVVTARGDGTSVRYDFGSDAITLTTANESDEPLSLFLLLDGRAVAAGDGSGQYHKLPILQEEWAVSAWYTGGSRLKIRGGTRVWGAPARPWQTWYAGLAPHETRKIVLEAGGVPADEAAAIAALDKPVAPPAAAQSSVCVMSLDDMAERVVFSSPDRWDCPIWAPDGKSLLCSSKGKLHRVALNGEPPQDFSTGAVSPGRDYAITTDGQRLAFSSGDDIYLVPAVGGDPTPIMPKKQGYIHGWSPDGRTVYYCATRGAGPMSIYSRLADGGEETRLLTSNIWSDAPEASPDGKWVYFTCDKSGKPAVWRMPVSGAGPDDSLAEQITNGPYRDWFPHPSPDGKWLLFLSSAGPGGSGIPNNQDVVLRLMPLSGGPIREVARLTGGQGTINAPCWSPDSRSFAYVRYAPNPAK